MSYQVLARKWRPRSFQELTGQGHVSKTLENAIKANRIAHAYLFSGVRGVGKTTVARILAKSLNCAEGPTPVPCMKCQSCTDIATGFSVDVVEIDGASHTGVDNVRELQERAQYAPLKGRYKIYIIDEVHMLSTSAFNALLKILEEPPPHIVFIFATTEPHKIPGTIHSRCQHFQFRRISYREIIERLRYILQEEGMEAEENVLSLVARGSDGSMRDALSLLDQVISYTGGNLAEGDVSWILGLADQWVGPLTQHILSKDPAKALSLLKEVADGGYDLKQFCSDVVGHLRNMTLAKLGMGQDVIDLPSERVAEMAKVAEGVPIEDIQRLFGIFSKALDEMRWFPYPRFSLEMAIIKASNMRPVVPVDDLIGRLSGLEKRWDTGAAPGPKPGKTGSREVSPLSAIPVAPSAPSVDTKEVKEAEEDQETTAGAAHVSIKGGSDMAALWRTAVAKINENKPSLGAYLEQGVPTGNENGILSIGFNGGAAVFINLIERQECKELILNIVKGYIPGVTGIKYTILTGKERHSPAYSEYLTGVHEKKQQEVEGVFSDAIVQEAIDILGGELVELRSKRE